MTLEQQKLLPASTGATVVSDETLARWNASIARSLALVSEIKRIRELARRSNLPDGGAFDVPIRQTALTNEQV